LIRCGVRLCRPGFGEVVCVDLPNAVDRSVSAVPTAWPGVACSVAWAAHGLETTHVLLQCVQNCVQCALCRSSRSRQSIRRNRVSLGFAAHAGSRSQGQQGRHSSAGRCNEGETRSLSVLATRLGRSDRTRVGRVPGFNRLMPRMGPMVDRRERPTISARRVTVHGISFVYIVMPLLALNQSPRKRLDRSDCTRLECSNPAIHRWRWKSLWVPSFRWHVLALYSVCDDRVRQSDAVRLNASCLHIVVARAGWVGYPGGAPEPFSSSSSSLL
jgi:hypothetical protein